MSRPDLLQGRENRGWFKCPRSLWGIGHVVPFDGYERAVLSVLMESWPHLEPRVAEICAITKFDRKKILKALESLQAKGALRVKKMAGASSTYDFTPYLDKYMLPTGVDIPDSAMEPPPIAETKKTSDPDGVGMQTQVDEQQPVYDPYEGLTDEQRQQADAFAESVRQQGTTAYDVREEPKGSLSWQQLPSRELQRRLHEARRRPSSLYLPSLGDEECGEQLHRIMEAVYADGQPPSHDEAWNRIDAIYEEFIRRFALRHPEYNGRAEMRRLQEVYGRYSESVAEPIIMQDFIEAYYGQHRYHEFDEVAE